MLEATRFRIASRIPLAGTQPIRETAQAPLLTPLVHPGDGEAFLELTVLG